MGRSIVLFFLLLAVPVLLSSQAAAEDGSLFYPSLSQGYLSSPENAFLLTGMCEKYLWDYPVKRPVREFSVEALHLGNEIGVRFNANGQVGSCYSYDFEMAFSYVDGRISKATFYKVVGGQLVDGIESVYEYPAADADRVEVWVYTSRGEKVHQATYLLDGFELTVVNERMNSKLVKTYDQLGRLIHERSASATYEYNYDDAGFLVLESVAKQGEVPQRSKIISYEFNSEGDVAIMKTKTVDSAYRSDYLFHIIK